MSLLLSGPESNLPVVWHLRGGFSIFGLIKRKLQERSVLGVFLGAPCTRRLSHGAQRPLDRCKESGHSCVQNLRFGAINSPPAETWREMSQPLPRPAQAQPSITWAAPPSRWSPQVTRKGVACRAGWGRGGSRGRGLRLIGDSLSCGKDDRETKCSNGKWEKAGRLPHVYRAVGFCENRLEDLRARQATRDVLPFLLPSTLASFPTSTEPAACKPLGKPVLHAAGGTCLQTGLQ